MSPGKEMTSGTKISELASFSLCFPVGLNGKNREMPFWGAQVIKEMDNKVQKEAQGQRCP